MSDRTLADRLKAAVLDVTKDWAKQRKAEERHAVSGGKPPRAAGSSERLLQFQVCRLRGHGRCLHDGQRQRQASSVGAASHVSGARPFIQEKMGGRQLNDQYFCQTLLPDYMGNTRSIGMSLDDDRGHFSEPHTEHSFGLGTINVRNYLATPARRCLTEPGFAAGTVETHGPGGGFGAVLFIEKEGFLPLFEAVQLAERYDLAIMSTKGHVEHGGADADRQPLSQQCAAAGAARLRQSRISDRSAP